MLSCIRVRDLAIIDALELEFGSGLNVITGETGAGKSILIAALTLALGGRGRAELVRKGAKSAEIEALFDISQEPGSKALIASLGLDAADELIVRRVVMASGRTRAYLNGRLATATQLSEVVGQLVDISSQHEHHTLVNASTHLHYLDAFGQLGEDVGGMRDAYVAVQGTSRALDAARDAIAGRVEREDLLRFQLNEITELDPVSGELEELVVERDRLRHAEFLATATGGAEELLYARDGAICESLGELLGRLSQAAEFDETLSPLLGLVESAQTQLDEAARGLGAYAREIVVDPQRLLEVEERLHRLKRLARKYGGDLDAVIAYRAAAESELGGLNDAEATLDGLEEAFEQALRAARQKARDLSRKRTSVARRLADGVVAQLRTLGMPEAAFEVRLRRPTLRADGFSIDDGALLESGMDLAEMCIAPNRGEPTRPLGKVASGGELSRTMLAIKRVLSGVGNAGTYIFDEVDSGVGGAVAEVIGRKLAQVAEHHQVICITHLAQIAVFAEDHFQVSKHVVDDRTVSRVLGLGADARVEEIARMMGGVELTAQVRQTAAEMLNLASGAAERA